MKGSGPAKCLRLKYTKNSPQQNRMKPFLNIDEIQDYEVADQGAFVEKFARVSNKINAQQFANGMPISENSVNQVEHSSRQFNNLAPRYMKNIYSPSLSPSSGSTTENFLKSKALLSSNFRHNEKATRYQMISEIDLKLYNMQKTIDLFI